MTLVIQKDDTHNLSCQQGSAEEPVRVPREEKGKSREGILSSAARLLRERGPEGASVADVMRDAGLTHGGFYRYFAAKDDLLSAALDVAFDSFFRPLVEKNSEGDPDAAIAAYRDLYLSDLHLAHPEVGCPIAAAGSDLGRAIPQVKETFSEGVTRIVSLLAQGQAGTPDMRHRRALRELTTLAGAVVIARASAPALAADILAAARSAD